LPVFRNYIFLRQFFLGYLIGNHFREFYFFTLVFHSKITCMLKQILSVSDVRNLKAGDRISDHPDPSLGKIYTVGNVADGQIYVIHDSGILELKILKTDQLPEPGWWMVA
jgi:hypothetical protein